MFRLKKYGHMLIGALFTLVLVSGVYLVRATDFQIPQRFKDGDVISADVMNEVFDYIERSQKTLSFSELVGNWNCTKYFMNTDYTSYVDSSLSLSLLGKNPLYQSTDASGLFTSAPVSMTIQEDNNGLHSWNSSPLNAFASNYETPTTPGRYADDCLGEGKIAIYGGDTLVTSPNCFYNIKNTIPRYDNITDYYYALSIQVISQTRIKIHTSLLGPSNIISQYIMEKPGSLLCDKIDTPPTAPGDLRSDVSGSQVHLSWTDYSSDELGFRILRKDSLHSDFYEIGVTSPNATTFDDVLPQGADEYWYRVRAFNANGVSIGTNVAKISAE